MAEKGRQFGLKKGPWTAEEDLLLTKFIEVHGVGRWRTLPQNTGLMRNRKSCRLRWKNYLRPNLNRDHISEDEEDLIIRLHKLLGNRWSLIAGRMPGRTDNQIKNYWNTRLSKKATNKCIRYSSTDKLQQMPNDDASLGSPAVSSFCNERSIPDANQISERDQQHIASTDNQYIAMENLYSTQKGKVQTSNSTCSDVGRDDATHLLMADMDEDQLVSNPSLFNSSIVSVNLLNDDLRFSAAIQEETTIPKFDSSNAGTISSWNTNGPSYCGPAHYMEDVLTYHEAYSTMSSDQILFPLSQLLDTSEYNQNITKSYDDAVASTTKHAECISDLFDTQWPNSSDIANTFSDCSLMYSENDYILSK